MRGDGQEAASKKNPLHFHFNFNLNFFNLQKKFIPVGSAAGRPTKPVFFSYLPALGGGRLLCCFEGPKVLSHKTSSLLSLRSSPAGGVLQRKGGTSAPPGSREQVPASESLRASGGEALARGGDEGQEFFVPQPRELAFRGGGQ